MAVPVNGFKAGLAAGLTQIGLWQALASPYTAEIGAGAGFDWLLLDAEHAPNDLRSLLAQLQAVAAYPVHAILRPPTGDAVLIKQYLDIGATSLLIPMVETAEQAQHLARAVRYPPFGIRGVGAGLARASRWSRIEGYLDGADAEICLLVQVETARGLRNLAEIAAVPGVDGIFIGPADLAASMGHHGRPSHPDVQSAIEAAVPVIRSAGKAAGILMTDETLARRYVALGFSFIATAIDSVLLAQATSDAAARSRALLLRRD